MKEEFDFETLLAQEEEQEEKRREEFLKDHLAKTGKLLGPHFWYRKYDKIYQESFDHLQAVGVLEDERFRRGLLDILKKKPKIRRNAAERLFHALEMSENEIPYEETARELYAVLTRQQQIGYTGMDVTAIRVLLGITCFSALLPLLEIFEHGWASVITLAVIFFPVFLFCFCFRKTTVSRAILAASLAGNVLIFWLIISDNYALHPLLNGPGKEGLIVALVNQVIFGIQATLISLGKSLPKKK